MKDSTKKLSYDGSFKDMNKISEATGGKLKYDQQSGSVHVRTDEGDVELKQHCNVIINNGKITVDNTINEQIVVSL